MHYVCCSWENGTLKRSVLYASRLKRRGTGASETASLRAESHFNTGTYLDHPAPRSSKPTQGVAPGSRYNTSTNRRDHSPSLGPPRKRSRKTNQNRSRTLRDPSSSSEKRADLHHESSDIYHEAAYISNSG